MKDLVKMRKLMIQERKRIAGATSWGVRRDGVQSRWKMSPGAWVEDLASARSWPGEKVNYMVANAGMWVDLVNLVRVFIWLQQTRVGNDLTEKRQYVYEYAVC